MPYTSRGYVEQVLDRINKKANMNLKAIQARGSKGYEYKIVNGDNDESITGMMRSEKTRLWLDGAWAIVELTTFPEI